MVAYRPVPMLTLFLAVATTTTAIDDAPRIVGQPLALWVWWASGILLLAAILGAGWYVGRRTRDQR
jgi:hypothetical protein